MQLLGRIAFANCWGGGVLLMYRSNKRSCNGPTVLIRVWASVVIRIITRQRIGRKEVGSGKKRSENSPFPVPSEIQSPAPRVHYA